LQQHGAVAIGQTSWGPTGFCAVQGQQFAEQLVAKLQANSPASLSFAVVSARNSGAEISVE
jgi:predicted sugar kinase